MSRWWWPWAKTEGSRSWRYSCDQTLRAHVCTHPAGHGWQHTSPTGFRWAA